MYLSTQNGYWLATSLIETESRNTKANLQTKRGGDGKRWPLTTSFFPAPWPCHPPAIQTPTRPVSAGPLISWPKNASCSRIPPRASRTFLLLRRWAVTWVSTCCQLPFRPCAAPLSCSLQPGLLNMSLLSLGPHLLQIVSNVSLLLNHGNLSQNTGTRQPLLHKVEFCFRLKFRIILFDPQKWKRQWLWEIAESRNSWWFKSM